MKPAAEDKKFCVDCKHCAVVASVTATGEPAYNCTGVISVITGKPLKQSCKEARYECKGNLWEPKS